MNVVHNDLVIYFGYHKNFWKYINITHLENDLGPARKKNKKRKKETKSEAKKKKERKRKKEI